MDYSVGNECVFRVPLFCLLAFIEFGVKHVSDILRAVDIKVEVFEENEQGFKVILFAFIQKHQVVPVTPVLPQVVIFRVLDHQFVECSC